MACASGVGEEWLSQLKLCVELRAINGCALQCVVQAEGGKSRQY